MRIASIFLAIFASVSVLSMDLTKSVSIHIDEVELNRNYAMGWSNKLMAFAVRDFIDHLKLVSKGSWPVNPQSPEKQRILLGKAAVQAYHLEDSANNLIFGAYRIKTHEDDLLIYGAEAQSTINGMYAFLENHLGFHWFGPTDDFRTTPSKECSLVFEQLDETVKPDFVTREMKGYPYPGTPGFIWGIRNRLFKIDSVWDLTINHNVHYLLPAKQYAKTHPEYYSMNANGQRMLPPNTQMCYSNPDVLEIVKARTEEFFQKGADKVAFSLSPSDNHAFCRCPQCMATQPARKEDIFCFTDMHMAFVEKIADQLKDKYPGRAVGIQAYGGTSLPPLQKMRNGDFYILAVTPDFSQYADSAYREKELDNYHAWLRQMPGASVHWHSYTSFRQIAPCYYPSLSAYAVKRLHDEFHAKSFLADGGGGFWPVAAPQSWMMGKLLWNVKADPEKLLDEYFSKLYGPAAQIVKALYDHLERRYLEGSRTGGKWFRNHGTLTVFNYYTAVDAMFCRRHWKKARSMTSDNPMIQRRIDYMSTRMEPVLQMLEGWDLSSRLAKGAAVPPDYGSTESALSYCVNAVCNLESQWQKIIRSDVALDQYAFHKHRPGFDYYEMLRSQWHAVCADNLAKALAKRPSKELEKQFASDPMSEAILGIEQKKYSLLPELLQNPGFEIGAGINDSAEIQHNPAKARGWELDSGSPESFKYGRVLRDSPEGKFCGIIRGNGNGNFISSCNINLETGSQFFILEAMSFKLDPNVRVFLRVMWRDSGDKIMRIGHFRSSDSEGTGEWIRQRIFVEAPKEAASAMVLLCVENLNESDVLFDSVSFRQISKNN